MIRRAFLKACGGTLLGLTLARVLPGIVGEVPSMAPPFVDRRWWVRLGYSQVFKVGDVVRFDVVHELRPLPGTYISRHFEVTGVDDTGVTMEPA